jgi:hypothetical protein
VRPAGVTADSSAEIFVAGTSVTAAATYILTCGCEIELQPQGSCVVWVATHRCDKHLRTVYGNGAIPVEGMTPKVDA